MKWSLSAFHTFLIKKVLVLLVTFFFAANLLFILPRLMPSSPVEMMIARVIGGTGGSSIGTSGEGSGSGAQSEMVKVLTAIYIEKFGVADPLEVQYLKFWKRIFTWDFGPSYSAFPRDVMEIILYALPWTLAIVVPIPIIGYFVGNWIGSAATIKKSKIAKTFYYVTMYLAITPYYWFALTLMYVFGVVLGWFPLSGAYSDTWIRPVWSFKFFLDLLHHYALPFISLVSIGIGGWSISMRASILSQSKSTYIEYSRQLGIPFKRIRKYIEKTAVLPNFTRFPMSFAGLIGQTLLVETVFGYPGLGSVMYGAAFSMDYPLLEATFMITIIIVLVGNFICDIIYGKLDPRIGSRYVSEGG